MKTYLSLFANADYRRLFFGQTGAVFGDALYQVAFYWLAYSLSGSPTRAGLVIFASAAPYLFFGLLGGAYADRLDRKRIMITGDLVRAGAVGVVPLAALLDYLSLVLVALVAFVLTSVRCFFYPAVKASVADVLSEEQRGAGVSFMQASFQAAKVIGLAVGGLLIQRLSAPITYLLPVLTYAISVACLSSLTPRPVKRSHGEPSIVRDLVETVRLLRPNRSLFWAIVLFGPGLLVVTGIDRIALPALSDRVWSVGSDGLGIVLSAFSIGNLLASLVLGTMKLRRHARIIFLGWALWGVFYGFLGTAPTVALALVFAFCAGASEALIDVPQVILIQTTVPRERMGKVFSMWSTVAFAGEVGSALAAGIVVGHFGPAHGYVVAGIGLVLVAMIGLVLTRTHTPLAAVET